MKCSEIPVCKMFGMTFNPVELRQAAGMIVQDAIKRETAFLVITPNVDHIVTVHHKPLLRQIYNNARYLLADGMPLVWLSWILPCAKLPERVTGSDLLYVICEEAAREQASIGFVGGKEGIAARAAANACMLYPGLEVKGVYSPPFGFEANPEELRKLLEVCNGWKADILCVGLGAPKQEMWADEYCNRLETGAILCFGAAIDFMAGEIVRAPKLVSKVGFEWLWRLLMEPRRMWRRYLVKDPMFLWLAIVELADQWSRYFRRGF